MTLSITSRRLRYALLHRFPQKTDEPRRQPGIVWNTRFCDCIPGGHRIPWREDPPKQRALRQSPE